VNGSIEGHRALVTGAGSGIGRAIALALAARGARVAIGDIDKAAAARTLEQVKDGVLLEGDVADSTTVSGWLARIRDEWGGLEILVNNASTLDVPEQVQERTRAIAQELLSGQGHRTPMDATLLLDDALWTRTLAVQLSGTFFCTREALRLMTPARYGRIVNMASIGGVSGIAGAPHLSAAAGGVISFTKSVASELIPFGVTVNAVAPGWIDTPALAPYMKGYMLQATLARIPLARLGTPEEVVPAVLLFVDPANGYTTGQVVSPNGGAVF
jgi:3-oxoacyl-[acyl-carrier protein] reductase